ncbi:Ig-like domain-containing protein [Sorangium sp. So ce887]|uniref:Ig-like domain-containing protein n=1 Tax=Sorangium sp. So ce887 TaxID=3133324 RepID=UPI003F63183A
MVIALVTAAPACDTSTEDVTATSAGETGAIHAALTVGGLRHDVVAVHYKLVAVDGTCGDPAIAETTSALEEEALPDRVLPPRTRVHAAADGMFVVPPGAYRVCATPMSSSGPSLECAPAEATANVYPEATSEIVLVSQCAGEPNGGLDVIVALNDPPTIEGIDITPSKYITECETATIAVTASDADGDAVTVAWELLSDAGELAGSGSTATFTPAGAGVVAVQVTVSDNLGGSSRLSFPLYVSPADCGTGGGVSVFSFVDTPADDVSTTSIHDWFSSLGAVSSSHHILFQIATNEGTSALCAENAAYYVENYITRTDIGGGGIPSGSWAKYWRVLDGPWVGPDTGSYSNNYAASCDESPYSWCAEWYMGDLRIAVMPFHTEDNFHTEGNGESYANGWSNGEGWEVTLAVGEDRLTTCGF